MCATINHLTPSSKIRSFHLALLFREKTRSLKGSKSFINLFTQPSNIYRVPTNTPESRDPKMEKVISSLVDV